MSLILTTRGMLEDSVLIKTETDFDNDHERTSTVEYCLAACEGQAHRTGVADAPSFFCAQHVHRSVSVALKEWPSAAAEAGSFS